MFNGNLIEELMASVDRAEENARAEEYAEVEPWFASAQKNTEYESKLVGVA